MCAVCSPADLDLVGNDLVEHKETGLGLVSRSGLIRSELHVSTTSEGDVSRQDSTLVSQRVRYNMAPSWK